MANVKNNKESRANIDKIVASKMKDTANDKVYSLSDSIEVIDTIGFGNKNIKYSKSYKDMQSDGAKTIEYCPSVVGFVIKNVGNTAIPYKTMEYKLNAETKKYVGTEVDKELKSGDTAIISRRYFTMLVSNPEFSFKVKNGKVSRGNSTQKIMKSLVGKELTNEDKFKLLDSYKFEFDADTGRRTYDFGIVLGVKGEDIEEKYLKTFAYLAETSKKKKTAKKSNKPDANTVSAFALNEMLKGNTSVIVDETDDEAEAE